MERNDDPHGACNTNSQIKFETSMLSSSFCDDSDVYVLVSRAITITGTGNNDVVRQLDERNKGLIF